MVELTVADANDSVIRQCTEFELREHGLITKTENGDETGFSRWGVSPTSGKPNGGATSKRLSNSEATDSRLPSSPLDRKPASSTASSSSILKAKERSTAQADPSIASSSRSVSAAAADEPGPRAVTRSPSTVTLVSASSSASQFAPAARTSSSTQ